MSTTTLFLILPQSCLDYVVSISIEDFICSKTVHKVVMAQKTASIRRIFKLLANVRKQSLMWSEILRDDETQRTSLQTGLAKEKRLRENRRRQLAPGTVHEIQERASWCNKRAVLSLNDHAAASHQRVGKTPVLPGMLAVGRVPGI